ncbi:hypothetical protein PPTG_18464 [Phytophthora nicotianae INRA-310]|uniref:Necrosis inducing-like protein NPP1 type n=1 Tax=Phytophthora nicotianae (strain INRA-310) TaxID=761204 RepID=W2PGD0_PHYN3|nr:hypothetical protein PPTG_18464 [Phytophthora nicotianae INRA-310]ETM99690.1 hypothetical protein PPTG_18464 [Phytophthora nicotianae INRA-310]
MMLGVFSLGFFLSILAVHGAIRTINHDQVQPFSQPEPTTDSEKSAVKYKPQLHISYGCHPYAAVQADGSVSGGLNRSGWANGDRKGSDLGSQVYSRSDWYRGKWAIVYAWYYPKGPVFTETGPPGQRHFWSYIVVWTDSPKPNHSTIQGVTIPTEVGYEMQVPPKEDFIFEQATVKVESYLNSENQAVQLTDESGEIQDLITWEQLTDQARATLSEFDFNIKWAYVDMVMPLKDDVFSTILEEAFPF